MNGEKAQKEMRDIFIQAYDELGDSVFRHCLLRVSDREEARDITQDAFMKIWDYMTSGKEIHNLKAFTFRVVNNLIIDWYRKKKPVALDDENAIKVVDESFFANPENISEGRWALSLLEKLDDKHKQAVLLRMVDGLSIQEISLIVGESENVVSVRVHRGIQKLKKLFI